MKQFVKAWEQNITIPTYETAPADKNPMFLEKRVYQGSSGKVYPHPVIESIADEKTDRQYHAVFLENPYLQIMILPELGGRIQRALDKTNGYDFVYYNHVIKPALVGLAGPWISGGIEFNWPQHHRPSTFDPVEWRITENQDGSVTVWVSEIEQMYHTKGMAGFTLYPDKAYLEIKGQLYNPTDRTQTFLWWANPAVPVNENTQSIFPPDVHAVMDHGKRDVSAFPIATGTYYKVDYSAGVDISRYKNIPVPTSYMAYHSDFDFIGNYDYARKAGLMHVADHHISPGKKQWTWGCGDFGKAWDRNLTDEDGPYIELMTGVYTDNQPDFSFIEPYEEKRFTQYFMPYKDVGAVKNATIDAMVNLEITENTAYIHVYCTAQQNSAVVSLRGACGEYLRDTVSLSPEQTYRKEISLSADEQETKLCLTVYDENGRCLVSYQPSDRIPEPVPDPASPSASPEEIETTEELFLTAVHLEQYRHATYRPEDYYLEGLRRDPSDIRLNHGYGKLLYQKGRFEESVPYFEKAIKKLTWKNPNPYTGEPYYYLGLALKMRAKGTYSQTAFDSFYKAIWNGAQQDSAYYQLACMACMNGEYASALDFAEKSLIKNAHHLKARTLKSALLRLTGRPDAAADFARQTLDIDCLDFGALYELSLAGQTSDLHKSLRDEPHNYIELSLCYASAGLYKEALSVLAECPEQSDTLLCYYQAWYLCMSGNDAAEALKKAASCDGLYCFPNRLEDILVLEYAIEANAHDSMAPYYLGNLLYDKGQIEKALKCWERSAALNPDFPTVHRNLSLVYFNHIENAEKALSEMETAFCLDRSDARVFFELDQLRKRLNFSVQQRLASMEEHSSLTKLRDDLYTEYVTLLNLSGQHENALSMIQSRKFHPWEGGEGKIPAQYKAAHIALAKQALASGDISSATVHLEQALVYPENLGEGKLAGCKDNDIYYLLGYACEQSGSPEKAKMYYQEATKGENVLSSAMYYNDQPPELYFYQLLAQKKLGTDVTDGFQKMIDYCTAHEHDEIKIDYFAVSLPDFLVFEQNLNEKNNVHCQYMKGLGALGLGDIQTAEESFAYGLQKDQAHQGIAVHQAMLARYRMLLA